MDAAQQLPKGSFSMRYVVLFGSLLAVASCQANVIESPDFVGDYSPIHPYNTEGEPSYVIRVLEDGRAQYEDVNCYDIEYTPREARWEMRGNRLVFLPVGEEAAIFGRWETDEAFLSEDGCGTAMLSYESSVGPVPPEQWTIELYRYEPCYVVDPVPVPESGGEGYSGCLTVRCEDLPDCDFAL